MTELRIDELPDLAYRVVQPHRGPGATPKTLIIRQEKLLLVFNDEIIVKDIIIMKYTKKMLTIGLTHAEWETLQKNLIKHRKEIK